MDGDENQAVAACPHKDVTILKEPERCPEILWRPGKALRPVIVGTGPAGLMAGLALAQAGANPILIERGKTVSKRRKDVNRFWKIGELNENSNVQFGEGGAGTFSDGKLTTGIKKDCWTQKVLEEFVAAGAPEEIMYLGKPHIGTDKLSYMVGNLRRKILSLGGEYRFETRLTDLIVKTADWPAYRSLTPPAKRKKSRPTALFWPSGTARATLLKCCTTKAYRWFKSLLPSAPESNTLKIHQQKSIRRG